MSRQCIKRAVEKCSIVKDFTPIFSYFHIQQESNNHSQMCEKIKYGISRNPGTIQTLTWNTQYQNISSITDIIHFADKYKSKLIIDVSPHDQYTYFLWKGIRHMYPSTYIVPRYVSNSEDQKKILCDSKNKKDLLENITIVVSNIDDVSECNILTRLSKNMILTSNDTFTSTEPTYATFKANTDIPTETPNTLLYVPVVI
jgi:hypothetical protein